MISRKFPRCIIRKVGREHEGRERKRRRLNERRDWPIWKRGLHLIAPLLTDGSWRLVVSLRLTFLIRSIKERRSVYRSSYISQEPNPFSRRHFSDTPFMGPISLHSMAGKKT